MEFHQKLQELRKQKGLTQEELAAALYVSRTAVSKWESGRGYPNIDSLKAIAAFFGVTVDTLLSGDQLLNIAEADNNKDRTRLTDLVFGLLDLSSLVFLFLPLFGQRVGDTICEVSLLALTEAPDYLRLAYFAAVIALCACGILTLAMQGCAAPRWVNLRRYLSLGLNAGGVLLFIISSQVYAAAFLFIFLTVKALMLLKKK